MSLQPMTISWDTWKKVADEPRNSEFGRYHVVDGEDERSAWIGNEMHQFRARVDEATLADWDANYLPASTLVTSDNDAIAHLIGLHPPSPPRTQDDKPVVVTYPATEGFNSFLSGRGDDVAGGQRGKGTKVWFEWTAPEAGPSGTDPTKTIELQFMEPIEVHDGRALFGPQIGVWNSGKDHISIRALLPATPHTIVAGTGNALKVPSGLGFDIFVPAAGNGNADLDLATVVPVENDDDTGYWNLDYFTGDVTPNYTGTGNADLIDLEVSATLLNEVPLGEDHRTFDIDAYKSEYIHPNWKVQVRVHKETDGAGWLSGWFFNFREKTQVAW